MSSLSFLYFLTFFLKVLLKTLLLSLLSYHYLNSFRLSSFLSLSFPLASQSKVWTNLWEWFIRNYLVFCIPTLLFFTSFFHFFFFHFSFVSQSSNRSPSLSLCNTLFLTPTISFCEGKGTFLYRSFYLSFLFSFFLSIINIFIIIYFYIYNYR